MNITSEQLRNIIQEELEAVLNESTEQMRFREIGKQDAKSFSGLPTEERVMKRMAELNVPKLYEYDYLLGFSRNLTDEQQDYLDQKSDELFRDAELVTDLDPLLEKNKKKPCKKAKGKKFVKRVNGKCRSYGDAKGKIASGTKKGDAYCARSAKIKKCKNPPCANDLSRKKWKCRGSKSMK